MNLSRLIKISAVAAIYVVVTILTWSISYKEIQFRFAEILVLLCFFRKDYKYAIIIGCLISNFFSPMMLYDIFFGTLQTFVAVTLIANSKNLFVSSFYPVITMPIIALELFLALDVPFLFGCLTTMLGEFAVVVLLGYPIFKLLSKNKEFLKLIEANQNVEVNNEV